MKIGDKVKVIGTRTNSSYLNRIGLITSENNDSNGHYWNVLFEGSTSSSGVYDQDLTLIDNNKNMNLKEKFITLFKSEPEKSFRKSGITDEDGILTDDGMKVFLGWLLQKNGVDFKKEIVDPMIEEEKEDKNCK